MSKLHKKDVLGELPLPLYSCVPFSFLWFHPQWLHNAYKIEFKRSVIVKSLYHLSFSSFSYTVFRLPQIACYSSDLTGLFMPPSLRTFSLSAWHDGLFPLTLLIFNYSKPVLTHIHYMKISFLCPSLFTSLLLRLLITILPIALVILCDFYDNLNYWCVGVSWHLFSHIISCAGNAV